MRVFALQDGNEDFWPAYTDILMVTCLVIMLLAVTFAVARPDNRIKNELDRRKAVFEQAFHTTMHAEEADQQIALVSPPGDEQTITFSNELLFDSGDAEIRKKEGKAVLGKVASLLKQFLTGKPLFKLIQVNGHTDQDPISTPQFPSNWHLSSARATSVVYFFVQNGIKPQCLSATGYAQYSPYDPYHHLITDKAKMRRIEVVLRYPEDWIAKQLDIQAGSDSDGSN